jgi:hypothetical protein
MLMTEEQIKKEKRNIVILIVLTIVWFGFFFHNAVTVSKEYESLEKIYKITAADDIQILNTQSNIIKNQMIIINNQQSFINLHK